MKLIVGLGNPGREYKNTRHNIGFMMLDNYLGKVDWKNKMESQFYTSDNDGEQVIFIKPQTFMNLSGLAVKKVVSFYKIAPEDILVIQDDLDLEIGNYKLKNNSSDGGHNGIKSIIHELNSDGFARLKIGIGKDERIPVDRYVLAKIPKEELDIINSNKDEFNNIIDMFIKKGIEYTKQNYNNITRKE